MDREVKIDGPFDIDKRILAVKTLYCTPLVTPKKMIILHI